MRTAVAARAAVALLLQLALASCEPGGEAVPAAAEVRILDVIVMQSLDAVVPGQGPLYSLMGSGLIGVDAAGQLQPGLAESWRVGEDGKSYVFRLRDAKWSDGSELTAEDVVESMHRLATGAGPREQRDMFAVVENGPAVVARQSRPAELGIEALTDRIIQIRLERPEPAFLNLLAHPAVAIQKSLPEMVPALTAEDAPPVVSGPFVPVLANAGTITLEKNPHHHDASRVMLDVVNLGFSDNVFTAVARFQAGQADMVMGGMVAGLSSARTHFDPAAFRVEQAYGTYGYELGLGSGPLSDRNVRRALAMSIDRDVLIRRLFNISAMVPVQGLLPPGRFSTGRFAEVGWSGWTLEDRRAEARRLLAEAGYDVENPLVINVAIPRGDEHEQVLKVLAEQWQQLNVEVRAEKRSGASHQRLLENGGYDMALNIATAPPDLPQRFLEPYLCLDPDESAEEPCATEARALYDEALQLPNVDERSVLFRRIERLLTDETPRLNLFVPVRWALVRTDVTGWLDNPTGRHPLHLLSVPPTPAPPARE